MCLSDEKDLSHSQVVTGSVASNLKGIDAFVKATSLPYLELLLQNLASQ